MFVYDVAVLLVGALNACGNAYACGHLRHVDQLRLLTGSIQPRTAWPTAICQLRLRLRRHEFASLKILLRPLLVIIDFERSSGLELGRRSSLLRLVEWIIAILFDRASRLRYYKCRILEASVSIWSRILAQVRLRIATTNRRIGLVLPHHAHAGA